MQVIRSDYQIRRFVRNVRLPRSGLGGRLGRPRCADAHARGRASRAQWARRGVRSACCTRLGAHRPRSNRPRLHGSLLFKSVAEDRGPLSTAKPADICSKTRNLSPTGCQSHVTFSVSLPRRAWKDSRFLSVTPTWNQPRTLSRAPSTAPSALTRRRTSGSSAQPSTPPDDQ